MNNLALLNNMHRTGDENFARIIRIMIRLNYNYALLNTQNHFISYLFILRIPILKTSKLNKILDGKNYHSIR